MNKKKIKKKKSTLSLFLEADKSFKKSVKTLLDFVNSKPALSRENKLAIVSGLFAPQWVKNVTYNEMRIALVRACWEKMCDHPKNNMAVRQAINDLTEFAFYAQKNSNIEMLSKMSVISYELTKDKPIFEPCQAQSLLRRSSWGADKAISLVLAKPGAWGKKNTGKKKKAGISNSLTKDERLWR